MHILSEQEYEAAIGALLVRKLSQGPATFESLVASADGAYPLDVRRLLERLAADKKIKTTEEGLWAYPKDIRSTGKRQKAESDHFHTDFDLPEPHPLDFDWRFTLDTLEDLLPYFGQPGKLRIAVLGAPTLFKFLADKKYAVTLFDNNAQIVHHLKAAGYSSAIHCDLFGFDHLDIHSFDAAFADPPWYVEYYRAFIQAAARLLKRNAFLLLSVLPRLTRPSAPGDRDSIKAIARSSGFRLLKVKAGKLRYATPPFEKQALKQQGFSLASWRAGDLYNFELDAEAVLSLMFPALETDDWSTFFVGKTLVRIKNSTPIQGRFAARPVDKKNMRLSSVSRRSPLRSQINLWTSRNIAMNVSRPDIVVEAMIALQNGEPMKNIVGSIAMGHDLSNLEAKKLRAVLQVLLRDAQA